MPESGFAVDLDGIRDDLNDRFQVIDWNSLPTSDREVDQPMQFFSPLFTSKRNDHSMKGLQLDR